jgi:hypothetical protein
VLDPKPIKDPNSPVRIFLIFMADAKMKIPKQNTKKPARPIRKCSFVRR